MSRNRIIAIVLGVALALLLFAVFRSCRSGTVPPAERGALDETSYRASHEVFRGGFRGGAYEIQGGAYEIRGGAYEVRGGADEVRGVA